MLQVRKPRRTVSLLQAAIRALYGFSPGCILTPERSSSLFLASVDSRVEFILGSSDVVFEVGSKPLRSLALKIAWYGLVLGLLVVPLLCSAQASGSPGALGKSQPKAAENGTDFGEASDITVNLTTCTWDTKIGFSSRIMELILSKSP